MAPARKTYIFLVSSCSCLCAIYWCQVLGRRALLQLHLSNKRLYYLLRCHLYKRFDGRWKCCQELRWWCTSALVCCEISIIHLKVILKSNLAKSRSFITLISFFQSFWSFTQSTRLSLPCSVQKFKKTIGCMTNKIWTNDISRDLGLRWVWDGYPILHSNPESRFWKSKL